MSILIENISKKFENFYALKNINLEINSGSLTALVGPSGSGKSTLLRIVAGFEKPDAGRIWLFGNDFTNETIETREIGFVFQNYALFPSLTVWDNIAFGLNVKKMAKREIDERVRELLKLIQLENFSHSYPSQLSGGQRQRVALARAIAIEPKLLLLDEPFGALDPKVRKDLREWLKTLHSQIPLTTLIVTHDQEEAMEIADQIVVFSNGKIEQFGTPKEIYDSPANSFVIQFLGNSNKLNQQFPFFETESVPGFSDSTNIFVRSHNYYVCRDNLPNSLQTKIRKIIYGESLIKIDLEVDQIDEFFRFQLSRRNFEKLFLLDKDQKMSSNALVDTNLFLTKKTLE
jgi:sulfate transport system ATP-binding protein